MKYILIRDDDVNFFTSPDVLEEVYGFIFENDIPINFSVIPAVNTAAKTESCHFGAGNPEPFLPEDIAGDDKQFPITGNPDLLRFLNAVNKKEFLLHGFEHSGKSGKYEFESEDTESTERRINAYWREKRGIFVDLLHKTIAYFGCFYETRDVVFRVKMAKNISALERRFGKTSLCFHPNFQKSPSR